MGADERSVRGIDELITFGDRADGDGFVVIDHAERRRCVVKTSDPVDPEKRPAAESDPPVDRIVSVTTRRVSIPQAAAYIRRQDETPIVEVMNGDERAFPEGRYWIELTTAIKLYVIVEDSFEITVTENALTVDFGIQTDVSLGARTDSHRPGNSLNNRDHFPDDSGDLRCRQPESPGLMYLI